MRKNNEKERNPGKKMEKASDVLRVLEKRTFEMSKKITKEAKSVKGISVYAFKLSGESYAIETEMIMEVVPLEEYTSLPGTSRFIKGVFSLRGQLLTIVDLAFFLGLEDEDPDILKNVVIVKAAGKSIGFLTGRSSGIRRLDQDDRGSITDVHTEKLHSYVKWMTRDQTIILNMERVMNSGELIVDDPVD
jgi:chemotaxis signal transduction protein